MYQLHYTLTTIDYQVDHFLNRIFKYLHFFLIKNEGNLFTLSQCCVADVASQVKLSVSQFHFHKTSLASSVTTVMPNELLCVALYPLHFQAMYTTVGWRRKL
jgi:hypothetical protein